MTTLAQLSYQAVIVLSVIGVCIIHGFACAVLRKL